MSATALTERLPTADEQEKASAAIAPLAEALASKGGLRIGLEADGNEMVIELPIAIGELVLDVLNHISRGEMLTFLPVGAELTTQEAAKMLNVSRPFLIKLIDSGELPCHMVGSHRRVRSDDLLRYKSERDGKRAVAMKTLQRLGQEFEAG